MLFGMTRGEIGLVAFVFALVYAGVLVPRLGERLGTILAKRRATTQGSSVGGPPTGGTSK
jgi:hypothetical protein